MTVYIVSNTGSGFFNEEQRSAIEAAYNNWNNRLNAGLYFVFQAVSQVPASPQYPYSQWQFGSTQACQYTTACTTTQWSCLDGTTSSTSTNVTPGYWQPGYQFFAHEVGHTFAIYDCFGCDPVVTVMEPNTDGHSAMAPRCCDDKLMFRISRGSYGKSGNSCGAIPVQATSASPGTAFLTPSPWNQSSVTATFPQKPQSGDTIIAGCLEIHYVNDFPTVTDNQGNNYAPIVGDYNPLLNAVPGIFYAATQNLSSQSGEFTLTCTSDHPDGIDLFAVEFADLGDIDHIVDDLEGHQGLLDRPYNCGTLTTTAVNDLIMSIYNNASPDDPVGISPTLGTIPACNGGENDGQGEQCMAQNGSLYEVGGISTYTATSAGAYTPAWNYGGLTAMSCADMALKVIGP